MKIKEKSKRRRELFGSETESVERDIFLFYFIFFAYLSDLRKLDHRFSLGLKAKLIYVTRATRGHQNLGVSSNSTKYRIFLLVLFLA